MEGASPRVSTHLCARSQSRRASCQSASSGASSVGGVAAAREASNSSLVIRLVSTAGAEKPRPSLFRKPLRRLGKGADRPWRVDGHFAECEMRQIVPLASSLNSSAPSLATAKRHRTRPYARSRPSRSRSKNPHIRRSLSHPRKRGGRSCNPCAWRGSTSRAERRRRRP